MSTSRKCGDVALSSAIGSRLREQRVALGKSQAEVSEFVAAQEVAGTTRQSQAIYEKGRRSPSANYLATLAAMGFDVGYLVTGVHSQSASVKPDLMPRSVRVGVSALAEISSRLGDFRAQLNAFDGEFSSTEPLVEQLDQIRRALYALEFKAP